MKNQTSKTIETIKAVNAENSATDKTSPIGEPSSEEHEAAKLKDYEDLISQNEKGPFITGRNLSKINQEGLYKVAGFKSFELYCQVRNNEGPDNASRSDAQKQPGNYSRQLKPERPSFNPKSISQKAFRLV